MLCFSKSKAKGKNPKLNTKEYNAKHNKFREALQRFKRAKSKCKRVAKKF